MKVRFRLRPIQNFFQGAMLLAGLVLTALIAAVLTMQFAIHGAEVKVPMLKDMTVAQARSQTAGRSVANGGWQSDEVQSRVYQSSGLPGG